MKNKLTIVIQLVLGTIILAYCSTINAYFVLFLDKVIFNGALKSSIVGVFIIGLLLWPLFFVTGIILIIFGMRNLRKYFRDKKQYGN